jgi:hypothetical protein
VKGVENISRIQNVEGGKDPLGRTQDVGKGQAVLVTVPGANGWRCEGRLMGASGEPQHQQSVHEAYKGRHALHCILFACRGVSKPQELLDVSKTDLNRPAPRVTLYDLQHRVICVRGEEHSELETALLGLDNDDFKQALTTGPVPRKSSPEPVVL